MGRGDTQLALLSRLHSHGTQIKKEYCTRLFASYDLGCAPLSLSKAVLRIGIRCILDPGSGYGIRFSGSPTHICLSLARLLDSEELRQKISICEPRPRRTTRRMASTVPIRAEFGILWAPVTWRESDFVLIRGFFGSLAVSQIVFTLLQRFLRIWRNKSTLKSELFSQIWTKILCHLGQFFFCPVHK